ncbi:MAG: hypothetical protein U0641_13960 [Anaerolineae bacterium]
MTPQPLPDTVLQSHVSGLNIAPGTLADQLDPQRPTLLVFLRHYG